jgi:hypothetical protein
MPHWSGAWEVHMRKSNGKDDPKSDRKGNGAGAAAPWDDQVAHLMSREGIPRDKARDQVILESLKRGDSSALAGLLIDGHVPAPNVRFVLALMLLENEDAEAALVRQNVDPDPWWVPHRFVIKARPARPRRPHSAEKAAGEHGPGRTSGPVMPDLGYQAAIACLDQAVLATDAAGGKAAAGKAAAGRAAAGKPPAAKPAARPQRPGHKPKR